MLLCAHKLSLTILCAHRKQHKKQLIPYLIHAHARFLIKKIKYFRIKSHEGIVKRRIFVNSIVWNFTINLKTIYFYGIIRTEGHCV